MKLKLEKCHVCRHQSDWSSVFGILFSFDHLVVEIEVLINICCLHQHCRSISAPKLILVLIHENSITTYESGTGKVLYQCWLKHLPSGKYWNFKHNNALFVLASYQRILDWCSSKFGIVIQYILVLSLSKCPRRLKTFLWHDTSNI